MQANTRKPGREDANQMSLNASSCVNWGSDPNLVQMEHKSQIHPEQSSWNTWDQAFIQPEELSRENIGT